jgi:peptidoglycan recognition protein LE
MILLVRTIQQFHVESRKWDDIAYNFLIGCDGNIYEGRGFNTVGAHTYGYNRKSIGISFVGTFMRNLPPKVSLELCKLLIETGVKDGHISPNYQLVGHCQCTTTESPGKSLFEEIQTWPHWTEKLDESKL